MKESPFDDLVPSRNRTARQNHRREVLWQILLPLVLVIFVVVIAAVVAAGSVLPGSSPALWRDLSLIWILLLTMVIALIPMAVLIGLVYGVIRLIGVLPEWFFKLQRLFDQAANAAAGISRAVTEPLVRLNAFSTGLLRLLGRNPDRRSPE